ncbi:uncharacterized protein LOC108048261 isoform X1 [Drosophila rhopaloa]|uniref:Uncharacterized protein LOC108048261 n=1 Tax=Drosophila rhopaloa TaxID=1041015 RepID=A0A6P4F5H4_DRORH|nr:uncharacterized protein LOC108048261 isoform X1 [Drosophila rhopaloa]
MCNFPTIALKISLLLLIPMNIAINIGELVFTRIRFKPNTNVFLLSINILACIIMLGFLTAGIYGTFRNRIKIIRTLMFSMVAFCLFRVVMWIVCGNLEVILSETITHVWFQINTAVSILCLIVTVMFCMRLHELSRQFLQGV